MIFSQCFIYIMLTLHHYIILFRVFHLHNVNTELLFLISDSILVFSYKHLIFMKIINNAININNIVSVKVNRLSYKSKENGKGVSGLFCSSAGWFE